MEFRVRKFLLLLATGLMMNVVNAAQPTANLAKNESLKINCEGSMPILEGNTVTCEVVCQVVTLQVFQETQYCDQTCSTQNDLDQTEITVTNLVNNQILFKNIISSEKSVEAATATARENSANTCTRFQFVSKSKYLPIIYK